MDNGTIKKAIIHSIVNTTVKFATGRRYDKYAVLGSVSGEIVQFDIPGGDVEEAAKLGELGNVTKNRETAYAALGKAMHKAYKEADVLEGVRIKEFRLPSGKRIDFIDLEKKSSTN